MADIPIQPDNEFSSDMVKAVDNIANNVKAGSNDLTKSFDILSKSIDSMKSSLSSKLDQLIGSSTKGSSGSSGSSGDRMSAREKFEAKQSLIAAKMSASVQTIMAKMNASLQVINGRIALDTQKTNLKIQNINAKEAADDKKSNSKIEQINAKSAADTQKSNQKLQQIDAKSAADTQRSNERIQQIDAKSAADVKKSELKINEQTNKSQLKTAEMQTKAQLVQQNAIDKHNNKMQELATKFANAQALVDLKSSNKSNDDLQKHNLKMQEIAQKQADQLILIEEKRSATLQALAMKAHYKKEEYDRKKADSDAKSKRKSSKSTKESPEENVGPLVGPVMPKDVQEERKGKVVLDNEQVKKFHIAIDNTLKSLPKDFKGFFKSSAKTIAGSALAGGAIGGKMFSAGGPLTSIMGASFGAIIGGLSATVKSSSGVSKKRDASLNAREQIALGKSKDGSTLIDESVYKSIMEKPKSVMETFSESMTKFKSLMMEFYKTLEESAKTLGEAISFAAEDFIRKFTGFLKPLFGGSMVSGGMKLMGFGPKNKTEHKADGGSIFEPKGTDTVPAMLTPGEFVVNKGATQKNKGLLEAINNGKAKGGPIGYFSSGGGVNYLAAGGPAAGGAGAIMAGIGIAMNSITSAVQIATGAVQMFGAALAKANPAMMEQIGIIMNDLSGVIGRALIPVVQMVIPLLRQYADYVDAGMKVLQPVIAILVDTFATLFDPMIQLGMTILNIVAPVLTLVGGLLSGFATILDPLIQMVAEAVESVQAFFTAILGPIPFMDILKIGFDALAQVLKMVQGVFSMLIASFQKTIGMLVSGLGAVLSKIPFMGEAGEAMKKAGQDLEGQAKNQFDKGMARVGEGASNLGKMIQDPKNYKLDDKTRFKAGEILGKDKGIKPGSSVGAAVREVQSMSISSIGDDIRKSAMMAGMGQKSQEELLGGIEKNLEKDKLAAAVQQGVMAANNAVQKPVVFNQPPNMNGQGGAANAVPA